MAIRTHFLIAIAPIRLWTVFPWIRTCPNGVEFTWLFLVLARYREKVAGERCDEEA